MKTIGGTHLILDGKLRDNSDLSSENIIQLFDNIVDSLNMIYLTRPVVTPVPLEPNKIETEEDEGGISVYAQITTSHIALHVWPLRRAFCMDIFSCKPFDTDLAGRTLWEGLKIEYASVHILERDGLATSLPDTTPIFMQENWGRAAI